VHGIPKRGETKEQRHAHGLQSVGSLTQQNLRDIAASFQAACVDILIEKIRRAAREYRAKCVVIGGGVSANSGLRQAAGRLRLPVYFPALEYCTDNAAMSAGLAHLYLDRAEVSSLSLDAIAS
jgi:N6-L-threonylcarbamoyladenine synthase